MQILWPVFAMFALTAFAAFRLGFMRYAAVSRREVDPVFFRAYVGQEPETLAVASRHLVNLFEAPVLFYVGCILAFVTGLAGSLPVALAWAYVGLRLIHSYIHLGPNIVLWRFRVFVLSWFVLLALWIVLAIGLATRG